MTQYLLGIDCGTTACKSALFDVNGRRIAMANRGEWQVSGIKLEVLTYD